MRSQLWSTGSSLEGGTDDPIQTRDYLPTSGDREAMSLAEKMLLNRTDSYESYVLVLSSSILNCAQSGLAEQCLEQSPVCL